MTQMPHLTVQSSRMTAPPDSPHSPHKTNFTPGIIYTLFPASHGGLSILIPRAILHRAPASLSKRGQKETQLERFGKATQKL